MTYLEQRALAAYYRAAKAISGNGSVNQPGSVEEVEHDGLKYVRLANVNGTLAMYRVRIVNGAPVLKGLKRWPAELNPR